MTRVLFVGAHGAAAAALLDDARFDGPSPPEAIVEALEEAGAGVPRRGTTGDLVVDTDDWGLPEPVGLCLEEAREVLATVRGRLAALPL
jgi:hypothetical protein